MKQQILFRLLPKALMTFLVIFGISNAMAYDFEEDSVYYNIIDDNSVAVTFGDIKYEGDVIIPSSVENDGVFYSVTSIGDDAFSDCTSLTSVEFPNSLTSISDYAFNKCTSLTSIDIPISVTSIGEGSFEGCSSLTSVKLPNSLTSISDYAFRWCMSLTSIEIPNSVISIGKGAFYNCASLALVELPDSLTLIADDSFIMCESLTTINLPDSVTRIGDSAFYWCTSLTSVELPKSLTSIGTSAFMYCISLTSVELPNSLNSIGKYAFATCILLTSIDIPDSVISVGESAFQECTSLTSVELSNSLTTIGHGAFDGCSSLTSVEFLNSLTSIDNYAFDGCSSLTSVVLPNSLTSIGIGTFEECISLTSIDLPDSVISIGKWAFSSCESLSSVICRALEIPEIGSGCFDKIPADAVLYVYESALEDYENSDWAQWFSEILPIIETDAPEVIYDYELVLNYDENELLVSATITWVNEGKVAVNTANNYPVIAILQNPIKEYEIEATVANNALVLDFTDLVSGRYTVEVPEGYVTIDDNNINGAFEFNIVVDTTTGINGIRADETGKFRVYNLTGTNVMNTGDANALKTLAKGTYIINGRKVAIK